MSRPEPEEREREEDWKGDLKYVVVANDGTKRVPLTFASNTGEVRVAIAIFITETDNNNEKNERDEATKVNKGRGARENNLYLGLL